VTEQPEYPVFTKNGQTQIAASPTREVELRYAGWRKRADPAEQPPPADTGTTEDPTEPGEPPVPEKPPAPGKPKQRSKPTTQ
jgi:hypothetical protein